MADGKLMNDTEQNNRYRFSSIDLGDKVYQDHKMAKILNCSDIINVNAVSNREDLILYIKGKILTYFIKMVL